MGRIQSNVGLATGLDIQKTVDQLIEVSAQPRTRLQSRISGLQSQQVAIGELTALVIGLQLQTDRIGTTSTFQSITASSSRSELVTATATGSPAPGNYSVRPVQTAQSAAASSNLFASSSEKVEAGNFDVRTGGFVDGSTALEDLRGGVGISRGKIRITDRTGTSKEIDLSGTLTVDDVIQQINNISGLKVNAKTDGDRIVISDTTGSSTSNLIVEEVGQGHTASDLGINGINVSANSANGEAIVSLAAGTRLATLRDGRGLAFKTGTDFAVSLKDGTTLSVDVNSSSDPTTVGQLITAINKVDATKLEAKISDDGRSLVLVDKTAGSGTLSASGKLAEQVGWTSGVVAAGTITGSRIQNTLSGPLLSSLNGGQGVGTLASIGVTNRAGTTTSINLSGAVSLRDVIDRINASGAGVAATLNRERTGIAIQDTTGGTSSNLIVANDDSNNSATKLKIAASTATTSINSGSLDLQFISETKLLSSLNQGRGIRTGSFIITDSSGHQTGINLQSQSIKSVGNLIEAINSGSSGSVQARLNETGDGITLIDNAGGAGNLSVEDSAGGNAALDLGIRKTSTAVPTSSGPQKQINSSQNFKLELTGEESISDLVQKINDSNGPLTASLLSTGSSSVRVLFSSRISGEAGRFQITGDDVGLSVTNTAAARDAVITIGNDGSSSGTLLRSSSNDFSNAFNGLSIKISGTSTDPIQISVGTNNSTLERNLQLFVDQFNKTVDKIKKETAYSQDTGPTGQLFGNSEVLRVEQSLGNFITGRTSGLGRVQSLEQLGVSLNEDGKLEFDKTKFNSQLSARPDDVKKFLTDSTRGIGVRAKKILDRLAGETSGALVLKSQSITKQIETSNKRIENMTTRLDAEKARLYKQFYAMEEAITKIKNNLGAYSNFSPITTSST